jgi:hypothetical protein
VETLLHRLERARRGAVVWVVCGAAHEVSRVMEFVRDHGCTPLPLAPADAPPPGPTPLLAVLADAREAEAWARAHPEVHTLRLPASFEALATALDAGLEKLEEDG